MLDASAIDCLGLDRLEALVVLEPTRSRIVLTRELTEADKCVLGIGSSDGLIGYAAVARLPFEAELQAIRVAESHRRQGVARCLLEAVVAQARGWECERLLLEVRAGNAAALTLYRRLGFVQDGRRRRYYPPQGAGAAREDAVLMSLPLG
ncbi:GNAT family N-acetyltransferase [Halomonas korlensis]|uniref:Ribosomal-protein-alanine N-acetyltransferase n=1 Tax=Halomonas korlensis TaxID=463301 RepID=A0A1I7HH71_9GAMM|nr:GNAT family N-acetyltransferase [Halomonas korlensis]SFU60011.1 ribosomal-protein-alanine N-acetyltransferase [Halomonas korlensis]